MIMECEEFLADYSDFLDRQFVEHALGCYCNHLHSCEACAEYDRVMRSGLHLVRELESPRASEVLAHHVVASRARTSEYGERGRAAVVAGMAAGALFMVGALAVMAPGRGPVELPPVVVETPAAGDELPSLWGPAPRFSPTVNLLQVPDLTADGLLAPRRDRLSLFRAPLRARRQPVAAEEVATQ
jgi:hypothetical protein